LRTGLLTKSLECLSRMKGNFHCLSRFFIGIRFLEGKGRAISLTYSTVRTGLVYGGSLSRQETEGQCPIPFNWFNLIVEFQQRNITSLLQSFNCNCSSNPDSYREGFGQLPSHPCANGSMRRRGRGQPLTGLDCVFSFRVSSPDGYRDHTQ